MIQGIVASGIGGLLAGAISAALLMGWYKDAVWQSSIDEIKIEAANVLIVETDKVLKQERLANARVRELESQHDEAEKVIYDTQRSNRELSRKLGGMRDPGRRQSCPGTTPAAPAAPGVHEEARTGARLSKEAEGFLQSESVRADLAALDAQTCYAYVDDIEKLFPPEEAKEE